MAAALTALSYLGLALLLGSVLARRWLTPGHPGWWPGAVGCALLLLAWAGQVALTLSVLGLTGPADMIAYATGTATGRAMLTGLLGALAALVAEVAAWPTLLSVVAVGVSLWGAAGIGHGDGHGVWVRLLHALHAGAMGVWVGGVLALVGTARPLVPALAWRFTPAAVGSVLVLAGTGLLMASQQLPRLSAWAESRYGQTLLVKLTLALLALVASLLVRRAFARRRGVRFQLVREALLLMGVLGVTGVLSTQAPPGGHGRQAGAAGVVGAGHDDAALTLSGVPLCTDPQSVRLTFDGVDAGRANRARRALQPFLAQLMQGTLPRSGVTVDRRAACASPAGRTRLSVDVRYLDPQRYVGFGGAAYTLTVRLQVLPPTPGESTRAFLADWTGIHSEERVGVPFEAALLTHSREAVQTLIRTWRRDNGQDSAP
ncbi:putative copper export protein [Deinococcus metalli]|uniref:Putative copper export protein n=1 Tax=Deinococcus metalli TaxID=1141878 RepID=A0A7W8NT06_9DEIO|nr:hypothetical protein [Deinococcus metalli]MBB5378543.1 putative copper export protein [Deinococcus metalli]GHF58468.1 hypothetical protein GCM10017781_38440 [Deinococcus metalli]